MRAAIRDSRPSPDGYGRLPLSYIPYRSALSGSSLLFESQSVSGNKVVLFRALPSMSD